MFHNILVPIDISEPALTQMVVSHVETQAGLTDAARVHFLTVLPVFPYYSSLGLAWAAEAPDKERIRNEAISKLTDVTRQFNLPEDRTEMHIATGSPKDGILDLASAIHADLIIIASHRPDITTYLLGSNASAVVRHAKCSVLVVR